MKFFKTMTPIDADLREKVFTKSPEDFDTFTENWLREDEENFDAILATTINYYWYRAGCPFYRLYPGLVEALVRIDTAKFSTLDLRLPFPAGAGPEGGLSGRRSGRRA